MSKRTVRHETIEARRRAKATPAQAFAAWADPDARSVWAAPHPGWVIAEESDDFRAGGFELRRFGPPGDPRFTCATHYFDIVPERRIVMAGTMLERDAPISCSLCTVELAPDGEATRIRVTEQAAFLDGGDGRKQRRKGWETLLDQLERFLAGRRRDEAHAAASDADAIRALIRARSDAIHARDAKRALEHLAPSAVCYDLRPPLEYRGAAARDPNDLEAWFAGWIGPIEVELRDPTIEVDGDLAFAFGLANMRGRKRDEGAIDLWYRVTLCLRRRDGEWKVVHEHVSVPFRMDGSEKAALDLKP